ncbi:MAG: membrane protein insertase YidC [Treponema sp.]|nr:membrane protein insertase YidC [Treponema sp.]
MDKNTIWAIVLSTLVIVGAYLIVPLVTGRSLIPEVEVPVETTVQAENNSADGSTTTITDSIFNENDAVILATSEDDSSQIKSEELITINTGCAEVVFTTKGGDIISYKLVNHIDMDTQEGVQLSDNVNEINRTCALALGTADNKIINDIFIYEKIDDYTLLFKKNFIVTDKTGKKSSFTLGKRYTFKPNDYMFKLDVMVYSPDGTGLDLDGAAYTLRTSPQIGPHYDPKQNRYENRQFIAYNGKKTKKVVLGNNQFKRYDKEVLWGGAAGKYFIELIIPADPSIWNAAFYSSKIEVENYANAQGLFERRGFTGSEIVDSYNMYFGPRNEKDLKPYNMAENNPWNFSGRLTESLQSSGWLSWLETILKWCLEMLHKIVYNWGICIIILTVLLKIVLFPLSVKQTKGTMKMQALQPKLKAIQDKYKNDQQRLQIETQKIYQEAGYNPASGCLPMLFQFLVIFAMYNLFNNYFEFRGASFIPKWIPDLTVGDSVYKFNFNIPLLGNQLRLLPIIYVATQIISGKITQVTTPGADQNGMNMKFMTYGMPLMFFFLFYNAPSGLLLYWLTSNILQVAQQMIMNKLTAKGKIALKDSPKNQKKAPAKGKARK